MLQIASLPSNSCSWKEYIRTSMWESNQNFPTPTQCADSFVAVTQEVERSGLKVRRIDVRSMGNYLPHERFDETTAVRLSRGNHLRHPPRGTILVFAK